MSRNARCFLAAASLVALSLSGCAGWDMRGDSFREDELSSTCRQLRPKEPSGETWGFSNKAMQIERDFGYQ
jgi:hypothetical protein